MNTEDLIKTNINVDINSDRYSISPYIYGINDNDGFDGVAATAIRQGGNRYTAYNWETNYSNAGSDWHHSSDTHISSSTYPADAVNKLLDKADYMNIPYRIATLQMAGFVTADKNGSVSESEAAPSNRWIPIQFEKGKPFNIEPDLNDGVVYMDEFVNHIVQRFGDAKSATGINGYSLDNEPSLWQFTHPRMYPQKPTIEDLITRSIALSKAVKAVDPTCEIFGPALYGFAAYLNFQDAPDWNNLRAQNGYSWFIDAYLDEMRKAEEANGMRLLDALDVHYYSEARGKCRVTDCEDNTHIECHIARMQAPRTLWETGYSENSWIAQGNRRYLPILPKIRQSIEKYYPETKLAITEYGFGGNNHVSGAVAQADALGIFGRDGVYVAALWHSKNNSFPNAAINLFTNYDGEGSSFGSIGVKTRAVVSDRGLDKDNTNELCTVYASLNSEDNLTIVATNKSVKSDQEIIVNVENGSDYKSAVPYMISAEGAVIKKLESVSVQNGGFRFIMPKTSVVLFEIELRIYLPTN